MFAANRMKGAAALGLLLTGVGVGVAGAQIAESFQRKGSAATGLFTLGDGEAVNFHASLDDDSSGPAGRVLMRLFDDQGVVRAGRIVSLTPGRSATLMYDVPGHYYAQAELYESSSNLSDRRGVSTTVEVSDLDHLKIRRIVCGENIGPSRW